MFTPACACIPYLHTPYISANLSQLGLKFAAFFNKLVEMMELLDGHLGYLSQYAESFNHCKEVREALSSAYGDLLSFCTGARNVFLDKQGNRSRWTSFRVFLRTTWEPFEENFNTLHSNFRNHVDIVIRTAAITEHERLLSKEKREAEEKENKLRHDLLAWLSELDFDQDHERIYSRRHMDTGNWLVDSPQFKDWENSKESSLLWCYGTPGVGKSVLASLVLETLSAKYSLNAQIGIIFVYFNFQDQVAQKSTKVLSTMIKQLARQKKVLPDKLKQFYEQYYREASFPTEAKLEAQLADISAEFEQVFIVMDAMDEFDDRNGFLPIISRFAQSSSSIHGSRRNGSTKFKIFVTSRKEKDIERTFTSCDFPIIEIEAKKVDADIKSFVQCQLNERPAGDVVMDARLKDRIAQTLISKSSGMFLWVRYQLDYLYEQPSIEDINKALDSLPPDMNSTYIRILEKIDKQIPARRKIAKRTLMWVVNAGRPLKLRELALAVSIDPDTSTSLKDLNIYGEQVILDACCNLLTESDGIVRPVHYTVQELLTGSDMNQMDIGNLILRQYRSDINVHSELARTCLQCLLCEELTNLASIYLFPYLEKDFPFCLYAARYWDYHAQKLPDPTLPADLVCSIDKFFDSEDALFSAYLMRNGVQMFFAKINTLNYCLAFDMLHLYKISGRLDSLVLGEDDEQALHHAAAGGSTDSIELLLGMGLSVTRRDMAGMCPLHYAARAGRAAAAELLLDRGADVDATDDSDCTPLHLAAEKGYEDVVRLFLYRGADANLTGGEYGTAMCAAAYQGCKDMVQMLLDSGADVNLTAGNNGTALYGAAFREHETIVQMLLDNGADINLTGGKHGTALRAAAMGKHETIVQMLLDNGADVNLTGGEYGSALCAAAERGDKVIVQMLLDNGADVNLTGGEYGSALCAAAERGGKVVVQMLLDNGADVNLSGGDYGTALCAAAHQGYKEIVRMLLDSGADMNLTGVRYGTALCTAARGGYKTIVRMLLDNGVDVNVTGGNRDTALGAAAFRGHETIVQMLLDNGADANLTGGEFGAALRAAAMGEHETIVQMLLDNGADVNLTSAKHGTALCTAAMGKHETIVRMLLDNKADVNLTGGEYGTALCSAAHQGCKRIVRMLLDSGADVNLTGGEYGTALRAAAHRGYKEIVEMLLDSGADVNLMAGERGTAMEVAAKGVQRAIVQMLLEY
ncbi:ankyrin repeat-containing domain protein [Morchella snyderi]|nr:ankyrin repeat-containing domain protein [Morchella snyderi]